jgi:hypothetical protein
MAAIAQTIWKVNVFAAQFIGFGTQRVCACTKIARFFSETVIVLVEAAVVFVVKPTAPLDRKHNREYK